MSSPVPLSIQVPDTIGSPPQPHPNKGEKGEKQQRPPKGEGNNQNQKQEKGQKQNQQGEKGQQQGGHKDQQSSSSSSSTANGGAATVEKTNTLASEVFRLALFDHLPRKQITKDPDVIEEDRSIHPATIQLGLYYQKGVIQSDDDRAHALMATLLVILQDYKTPPKKVLREDLDKYMGKQIQYLVDSRPISKGMGNIIRYMRQIISKVSPELNEYEAKNILLSKLTSFQEEKMIFAIESITNYVSSTINEDDVILTFGSSPLIRKVLLKIAQTKKFQLVVVDTRPLNEGLQTLSALSQVIRCIYSPLSGIAVALHDVNKVVLGASCLLSNGSMLAPAGTAMVASMATALQIPVLVACESYKFSDKVHLDPIVFNELGHTSEISVMVSHQDALTIAQSPSYSDSALGALATSATSVPTSSSGSAAVPEFVPLPQVENKYRGSADKASLLMNANTTNGSGDAYVTYPHKSGLNPVTSTASGVLPKLPYQVVNLRYDLTPLSNISVVATETGLIPPTSVPVLIREIQSDLGDN